MFRMIGVLLLTLIAALVLFVLGVFTYYEPMIVLKGVLYIVTIFGILMFIAVAGLYFDERKLNARKTDKPESLLYQKYRAHKEKICPYVVFED